ncbi:MAG: phosphoribosylaminoimidazolesuccinocarboxamide synthase [Verrucomicrobiae bacterium]|nr:phosphoribosylaminoimidazolesuccinocarboxamide synthase [Verrucomicrobiae bacterium]
MPEPLTHLELPEIPKLRSGKVREVFDLGDKLLFVATDRISAFDCILPQGIPYKGHVLNQISSHWFHKTNHIVLNHFKTDRFEEYPDILQPYRRELEGRSMIVQKLKPIPVECVVRGYLTGSAWKEYRQTGQVCGVELPEGLPECAALPEPIFTPAAKNDQGHDENINFDQMCAIVGRANSEKLAMASFSIFEYAQKELSYKGLILADTKFEFGFMHGETVLMDECLTPDSSRFWIRSQYAPGRAQAGMDKQFVRDYLESVRWDKQPPAPDLPREVVIRTSDLYRDVYCRVTGQELNH